MATLPFSKMRRADNTVYLSGELEFGPEGNVTGDIRHPTAQTQANIAATLAAEGLSLQDVTSCYLTDRLDFAGFNEAYRAALTEPLPTRSTVLCDLVLDAKIEITVTAQAL
jgi:enamine deaminase RidA (YjgF/YER057c/UK114 family)